MPSQLQEIIAFCSKRDTETRDSLPRLAKAHLAIVNFAYSLRIGSADAERLLLNFLRQQHEDPDLAKACKEALEHIGAHRRRKSRK